MRAKNETKANMTFLMLLITIVPSAHTFSGDSDSSLKPPAIHDAIGVTGLQSQITDRIAAHNELNELWDGTEASGEEWLPTIKVGSYESSTPGSALSQIL